MRKKKKKEKNEKGPGTVPDPSTGSPPVTGTMWEVQNAVKGENGGRSPGEWFIHMVLDQDCRPGPDIQGLPVGVDVELNQSTV